MPHEIRSQDRVQLLLTVLRLCPPVCSVGIPKLTRNPLPFYARERIRETMRVTELFAGIGAQRMALTLEGIPHTIAGISEIDRHALASYGAIYGDCPNLGDITRIDRLPPCDLVTYSFPCQDLSLAGKRAGMGAGTRSGLVWEVVRLLETAGERERPEWLLMENVPQVLTSPLWPDLVGRLEAMGYRNRWTKLDSSRFGSAQKRVRAFMLSRLDADPPELPQCTDAPRLCLRDVMEPERAERYVKRIPMDRVRFRGESPKAQIKVVADWERKGMDQANRLYSSSYSSPAIMCHGGGKRDVKVVCSEDGSDLVVSILTPRECWRLMGFPDWAYDRAAAVSSETQLYNQAGNSIVVEVLRAIFRAMEKPEAVQTSIDTFTPTFSCMEGNP